MIRDSGHFCQERFPGGWIHTIQLGNKRAADARAACASLPHIDTAEVDANRWKNRDVEYRVECLIEVFGTRDFESNSSVAQVHHTGRAFDAIAYERVSFCADQGDPLPPAPFRA